MAGAKDFSMSQQINIFDHFSKLRIYNCIMVSQEHDVTDKENSRPINGNDVGTGITFEVYTWFPYQSSDRCIEVIDITLLDSWVISTQEHFTKNTNLFPRKSSNKLNGCPMTAVVREGHCYFTTNYVQNKDSNSNVVRYPTGLEYDLLKIVLEHINMSISHVTSPEAFEIEVHSLNNLIASMIRKEACLALGGLGTNYLSVSYFDSTNTY